MKLIGIVLLLMAAGLRSVAAMDLSGYAAAEGRWFVDNPQFAGQDDSDSYSAVLQPELRYSSGHQQFTFVPFYRHDSVDDERSHGDVRELYWRHSASQSELLLGINRVFWGVTESRHLVDIINQTDQVEDIDGEDKLGQPMAQLSLFSEWGNLSLFVLPHFRERTFAGIDGRLRAPWLIDADNALYESKDKDRHIDYALRYTKVLGDWDIGLSAFDGTSREPLLSPATDLTLLPYYEQMRQFGADLQYTKDAWLLKFEGIARQAASDDFVAGVGGFEYTFYQLAGGDKDVGVLMEYHYDDRSGDAPFSVFDRNVFVGSRIAFNDIDDTQILFGVTVDDNGDNRLYNLEVERRLSPHIKLELQLRVISAATDNALFTALQRDDYLQVQLQYHL